VAYCLTGAVTDLHREAVVTAVRIGEEAEEAMAAPLIGVEAAGEAAEISECSYETRKLVTFSHSCPFCLFFLFFWIWQCTVIYL
jgi:hypothetical protein